MERGRPQKNMNELHIKRKTKVANTERIREKINWPFGRSILTKWLTRELEGPRQTSETWEKSRFRNRQYRFWKRIRGFKHENTMKQRENDATRARKDNTVKGLNGHHRKVIL
jgi:hypothetical protein